MPSGRWRSSCSPGLRRSSSSHPSSRASGPVPRERQCEPSRRASTTTGPSRGTSNWLRRRSATEISLRESRPTWASFGEAGRAASVAPSVSRHGDHVRRSRDRDRPRREVHRWLGGESDARGGGVLRRGNRLELVAISPPAAAGARRMTAVDTFAAAVEARCGDLSTVRAPRGTGLNARSWATEAPLRLLLNNLDAQVAELPEQLIVYGGSGKAARSHEALKAIVASLLRLEDDETLLVQSGKPVGVYRTHPGAPRVLIANSLLVPHWVTWDEFRRLEALGLTMFGQMTAGSWIYIGTQGILQGTCQMFVSAGERHFDSADLAGRTILTAGLGGMGGAQPLAATLAGGAILCVEVDPERIRRRLDTRYLDEATDSVDDALARVRAAAAEGTPLSVGLQGNPAEIVPELARPGEHFDLVTDQTAAHDPLNGYVPAQLSIGEAASLRTSDPDEYLHRARASIATHVEGLLEYARRRCYVLDFDNYLSGDASGAVVA